MLKFRDFFEAEEKTKKQADFIGSLYSVLNIDPDVVDDSLEKSAPVVAQMVNGGDQYGLIQIRVKPAGENKYHIKLYNDYGNLLYNKNRKVKKLKLSGVVDRNTLDRILTQGLTGWNNEPGKEQTAGQPPA